MRTRTRGLAAASATMLLLGLAACGGSDSDSDSDAQASQDPDVTFTGDPVKVMTLTAYDTDTLNVKAILDIAQGAVTQINNAGGLGGHELQLITCNEGADPNKAADCARQAVDEGVAAMVGGFTANGDAIMPILEDAGIPWFAPPGISAAELSSEDSYPITSGVLGLAGLGQMAAQDGCDKVASVNYDLPSAGQIGQLVDIGLASEGHDKSDLIKVPPTTTDFSTIAQETSEYDCAVVGTPPQPFLGIAASGAQLGSETKYYVVPGGLTDAVTAAGGEAIEGAVTLSNFPGADDQIWDSAKDAVGDLGDDENGGWSALYLQNTWVGYRTFLSLVKNNDDFSAAGVKATLDATTSVDTDGFTPPFSFAEDFPAPGLNRVFNYQELKFTIDGGKLTQDGDDYVDQRTALVPAS
ncbi:ABC transporter substrate-binding protein [Nocardioides anomalus]|uniref:ABC transporter substrate-binding protein n=1 Tax=Nocardioides anomalus TaxID=2712223 RepID=A0A6G6WHK6_9ACTN|nr:ABC transporter substrate-binding protein [Nocardioides anomalus]QIG44724.1 ABC transporter substrate-binding protein [Nocardioides anomalus]